MARTKSVEEDTEGATEDVARSEESDGNTVTVKCTRCGEIVDVTLDKLRPSKTGRIVTMLCPACKDWTTLKKHDRDKALAALTKAGRFSPADTDVASVAVELEEDDEEFDPNRILERVLDEKVLGVKAGIKSRVLVWAKQFPSGVQPWQLKALLTYYGMTDGAATKVANFYAAELQREMLKHEKFRQLLQMFPMQSQVPFPQQPGMGVVPPGQGMPWNPQTTYFSMQNPLAPPAPYGAGQPYSPYGQPQPQPYQEPERERERERVRVSEDDEELVEEVLDSEGRPKKRIVRRKKKDDVLSQLAELQQLGIIDLGGKKNDVLAEAIRAMQETVQAMHKTLESLPGAVAAAASTFAPKDEGKPKDDEKIKELMDLIRKQEEKVEKLRDELRKREEEKKLLELRQELENRYGTKLAELEKALTSKNYEGLPETVQEMQVRKDMLGKVTDDAKEIVKEFTGTVLGPFAETFRSMTLQNLIAWEEAGKIPPGTVRKMLDTRPASKEDVERAKQKLAKLTGGKE